MFTGIHSPKKATKVKYSGNVEGGFSTQSFSKFNLPPTIVGALVSASNNSLAMSTWSNYKTAESHLKQCERDTNIKMDFPMDDREICVCLFNSNFENIVGHKRFSS